MLICTKTTRSNIGFTQANREQGIRRLTAINLMKRMESSVHSFNLTLKRMEDLINGTIHKIDHFKKQDKTILNLTDLDNQQDYDEDDQNNDDLFTIGKKSKN